MENKIVNNKYLYWSLITTFILLYLGIGFVSTVHSISFFEIANGTLLAIILGAGFEIAQSTVLFYILMSKDKQKLPWIIMTILVLVQITANIYSSFRYIDLSHSNDWTYFQRSILFSIQAENSEMYKVIISYIQGGVLPVCTLALTALIAHVIQIRDSIKFGINETKEIEIEPPIENNEEIKEPEKIEPILSPTKIINEDIGLESKRTKKPKPTKKVTGRL